MFSSFGRRSVVINLSVTALGGLQLLGYYWVFPRIIKQNFDKTALEEKENYSQPVLIVHEDQKFVFKHRGGKKAAESILNDTFENSKMLKRAVFCQILTCFSVTIGYAKSRKFMLPVSSFAVVANLSLIYPIFHSAVNLFKLSTLVRDGDVEVWGNLNEARYAQRMIEFLDPVDSYSKQVGMFGSLAVILYCTPVLGVVIGGLGKKLSIHKRLQ